MSSIVVATRTVVKEAASDLQQITGVDVVHQTALVAHGNITEYRATVHVAFIVEHHSHLSFGGVGVLGRDGGPYKQPIEIVVRRRFDNESSCFHHRIDIASREAF
ncbi:dodecin domain-containing protein [Gimesia panareensis]|uniref:dodecin domain-containing protein n=1 Tax=Gimesia panareensis TaxID=2527978 RepID=UPI00118A7789|nr:dodecin domain-containing protein [Gimesia panareensis]QDU49637.1 hypothetical protein Pan110_19750 [Gimesia panareensis]